MTAFVVGNTVIEIRSNKAWKVDELLADGRVVCVPISGRSRACRAFEPEEIRNEPTAGDFDEAQ